MNKYSLTGVNGNAYAIMGYTANAMQDTGYSKEDIENYYKSAKSSDYSHLLAVSMDMLDRCNERLDSKEDEN